MATIYYNQADSRWANHPYISPTHPDANLKSSGCGATSAAMLISSLVKTVLPNEMADLFKKNGYRANEGTSLEAFDWLSKNYNLVMNRSSKLDDAVNCLHRGRNGNLQLCCWRFVFYRWTYYCFG